MNEAARMKLHIATNSMVIAQKRHQTFIKKLEEFIPGRVCTGMFGANMQVHLVNDEPVTLWMDSTNPE
jgi:D-Tyr-tRNAtyr deacylase